MNMEPGVILNSKRGHRYCFRVLKEVQSYQDFVFKTLPLRDAIRRNFSVLYLGEEKLALFNDAAKKTQTVAVKRFFIDGEVKVLVNISKYNSAGGFYECAWNAMHWHKDFESAFKKV